MSNRQDAKNAREEHGHFTAEDAEVRGGLIVWDEKHSKSYSVTLRALCGERKVFDLS